MPAFLASASMLEALCWDVLSDQTELAYDSSFILHTLPTQNSPSVLFLSVLSEKRFFEFLQHICLLIDHQPQDNPYAYRYFLGR